MKHHIKRICVATALLLVVAGSTTTQATIHVFTNDSLPRTLGSGYAGDTIRFAGTSVRATGSALNVNAADVYIDGQGDTLFYGSAGGSNNEGLYVTASGDRLAVDRLNIIHSQDTLSAAFENSAVYLENPAGVTFTRCSFVVYGDNARCIDSYGLGTGTKNVVIDRCHFWNHCRTYNSRSSYDGAAVRLEMRGSFSGSDFGAHITSSVVHTAPHSGFVVLGKASTVLSPGNEISYCTTYVDHRNPGGSSANPYGIIVKDCRTPLSIHHNAIFSGKKYGGSRGIILENVVGTPSDWVQVYNNHVQTACGPDAENGQGVNRVLRLRSIDGHYWDYVHIYDNLFVAITDNLASTTHIGTDASVFQFGAFGVDAGHAHGIFERNTVVYRSLTPGTDGTAAEFSVESTFPGVPPITIRHNKYLSSQRIVWMADEFNAQSSHDLTFFEDTLGFLPPGDSGVLVNPVTWSVGYYNEDDHGEKAVNCYYINGANDKDILLYPNGSSHEFSLVQRSPIVARGNNDSLVASFRLRITNSKGTQVLNTTVSGGVAQPDLTYWYESTSLGAPVDYNPYTFVVGSGSDSTTSQRTIGYLTSSVVLSLPNTRGTLPLDYTSNALDNVSSFGVTLLGTDRSGESDLIRFSYRVPDNSSGDSVVACFGTSQFPDSLALWRVSRAITPGEQVTDTAQFPVVEPANVYISYWLRMASGSPAQWSARAQASVFVVDSIAPVLDTISVSP